MNMNMNIYEYVKIAVLEWAASVETCRVINHQEEQRCEIKICAHYTIEEISVILVLFNDVLAYADVSSFLIKFLTRKVKSVKSSATPRLDFQCSSLELKYLVQPTTTESHSLDIASVRYCTILYYTSAVLYYTILVLYYTSTILYYTLLVLYYTILYSTSTILYYTSTVLYYTSTILYYTILVLYYTILYCTILYYTILYYTILYYTSTVLYYTREIFKILTASGLELKSKKGAEEPGSPLGPGGPGGPRILSPGGPLGPRSPFSPFNCPIEQTFRRFYDKLHDINTCLMVVGGCLYL
uniref:Uncharacterized protein n=1 Tax=Glossina austeni TaxID=7395 RepID=A0A1A9V5U0_GLOAU